MAVARLQPAAASDDSGWCDDLFEVIKERSFRRGHFTLASGIESELYFNMKPTMMDPRGAYLAAWAMLNRVHEEKADFVGGLAIGAVPTLGAVAAIGHIEGRPIRTFFVRQKAKEHGTRQTIEGLGPRDSLEGKRVVVVDDVATTGGSIMLAIEAARAAGAIVEVGLVIVDREEGARALLQDHGVRLTSIFRAHQFL